MLCILEECGAMFRPPVLNGFEYPDTIFSMCTEIMPTDILETKCSPSGWQLVIWPLTALFLFLSLSFSLFLSLPLALSFPPSFFSSLLPLSRKSAPLKCLYSNSVYCSKQCRVITSTQIVSTLQIVLR